MHINYANKNKYIINYLQMFLSCSNFAADKKL